jgi:hypothetical protein
MLGKSRLASLIHIRKRIKRNDLLSINLSSNPTTNLSNTILGLSMSYTKNL